MPRNSSQHVRHMHSTTDVVAHSTFRLHIAMVSIVAVLHITPSPHHTQLDKCGHGLPHGKMGACVRRMLQHCLRGVGLMLRRILAIAGAPNDLEQWHVERC
eukprot:jgi/Ulvmu1/2317/UM013_0165.1